MIISEWFSCTANCKGHSCEFIENSNLFSIINKTGYVDGHVSEEIRDKYFIQFTSSYGTLNEFVRDIYLHKEQMLPLMDDDVYVVYKYEDQCNLSFDPDLLRMISDMNLHLLVTCFSADESDDSSDSED